MRMMDGSLRQNGCGIRASRIARSKALHDLARATTSPINRGDGCSRRRGDLAPMQPGNHALQCRSAWRRSATARHFGVIRSAYGRRIIALRQVLRDAKRVRGWQGVRDSPRGSCIEDGIPVSIIARRSCGSAQLMRRSQRGPDKISWVITGADRVAANGDVANTRSVRIRIRRYAARAHGV